jgi:hypothetical protein
MIKEYTHIKIGWDGCYSHEPESRRIIEKVIEHDGKKYLGFLSRTQANYNGFVVAGKIVEYKTGTTKSGLKTSKVEIVEKKGKSGVEKAVKKAVKKAGFDDNLPISFW